VVTYFVCPNHFVASPIREPLWEISADFEISSFAELPQMVEKIFE